MSTILDALRKVEKERRASGPSPRERLLLSHQVTPPPSRKGVWVIGLVLIGVGFASGVGVMLFRSEPMASIPAAQPAPSALALTKQPSAPPVSSPSDPPAAIAATSHPAEEQGSGGAEEETGQRSPFATSREQYQSERQLYEQLQDTLDPQLPSPSSSLGTPKVLLNLLQWSPETERRLAFIRINGGPMLMVHEGDTVSDLTVERILPDAVELRFGDSTYVVKPNSSSPAPSAP